MATAESYEWTEHDGSGRGHLIEKDGAQRPVPSGDGTIEMVAMSLCGTVQSGERREFKGFDNHRNIRWCRMCKHLYFQRHKDGGLFG